MISICTPTYNRAHTLPRLFDSLTKQTNQAFEWIVIDDGSIDNTKELIKGYMSIANFSIIYKYQTNQGKHIALNIGQELAKNDVFLCLDSDDWLVESAVCTIVKDFEMYVRHNKKVAGMLYLDELQTGEIIGSSIPHYTEINWLDLVYNNKLKGDKCYIFKTEVLKKFPFPTLNKGKHMPPTYQFHLISREYNLFSVNTPLKVVEYLDDGLSKNIKQKYFTAADNYAYYRKTINNIIPTRRYRIKNILLYNLSYLYSKNKKNVKLDKVSEKFLSLILFPLSILIMVLYKKEKGSGRL
ncbi:glycosyltransferase family 2 protein [Virgibacillus halodenitrificans]|uniref:glycosyltransferase family 2 protein n=1 Tax=Virgibacillus halodenitrificans TaxID=1482 RepID=UPI001FB3FE79|nr:glycosyltransferase family 2 protein [Virgibacillus halodenitrificans]MCJ0929722.1 glycosyltransferase family 2 protein [Virgibacillus halodenitrificans]